MPGKITAENVEQVFGSVETDENQKATITALTTKFTDLAREVILSVPDCAHRSAALRDLLTAKWACVDAVAKGGLV